MIFGTKGLVFFNPRGGGLDEKRGGYEKIWKFRGSYEKIWLIRRGYENFGKFRGGYENFSIFDDMTTLMVENVAGT